MKRGSPETRLLDLHDHLLLAAEKRQDLADLVCRGLHGEDCPYRLIDWCAYPPERSPAIARAQSAGNAGERPAGPAAFSRGGSPGILRRIWRRMVG
jgi:hypothetical protein